MDISHSTKHSRLSPQIQLEQNCSPIHVNTLVGRFKAGQPMVTKTLKSGLLEHLKIQLIVNCSVAYKQ